MYQLENDAGVFRLISFMSYDIYFLDDEFGTVTEFNGVLTDEIIVRATRERFASEERNRKYKYVLADYTNCTKIGITSEAVIQIAYIAIDVSKYNQGIIFAGVLPTDLEFGLGRMWQAYSEKTGWESKMFRSRSEAEEWIQNVLASSLHFNNPR